MRRLCQQGYHNKWSGATLKEVAEVPGIGATIAEVIVSNLEKERTHAFDANTGEILEGS